MAAAAVPNRWSSLEYGPLNTLTEIVAIDGPAGAGKSTVARRVARELGMAFLDTGAMYRAATWRAMKHGVPLDDPERLVASTSSMQYQVLGDDAAPRIVLDGEDVTNRIRTPEVTGNIRCLDGIPRLREHLVAMQRELGALRPTVAEGRDMGTVVFPGAKCKIFLDASLDSRTRRRAAESTGHGADVDLERLREDIRLRDENDRSRAASPLRPADDAMIIDTTGMSLDEVTAAIVSLARERI